MHTYTHIWKAGLLLSCSFLSVAASAAPAFDASVLKGAQPFAQDFTLTAYYSPLPNQCCYVMGSYEADVKMNGNGTHGADGTPVYPGMLAGPPSYPFGTRIVLPGLGIATVHDRGGAIQLQDKSHRLDVWVGTGEEGLARALAFGVKHIRGTVYPVAAKQPAESLGVDALPSPLTMLRPYMTGDVTLLDLQPKLGEKSVGVEMLQQKLKDLGYFPAAVTGSFGPATRDALQQFYKDAGLEDSADAVSETGAAYLIAWKDRSVSAAVPMAVDRTSAPADIASLQRTLRYLGFYHGRTSGAYDDTLFKAILDFQKQKSLVGDASSPGAGRVGPKTRREMLLLWQRKLVAGKARTLLAFHRIDTQLAMADKDILSTFGKGAKGPQVTALQNFLAARGYLKDKPNGNFGTATEKALAAYQLAAHVITKASDKGAGTLGPATLAQIRRDRRDDAYRLVRAQGWQAI
jgi:peptidoglycan hydrolase-like protein with peptidoglycan-binding domain/3D (Asp-Asp-Asp) domain-containing protein